MVSICVLMLAHDGAFVILSFQELLYKSIWSVYMYKQFRLVCLFTFYFIVIIFFEIGSHFVALAVLELTM